MSFFRTLFIATLLLTIHNVTLAGEAKLIWQIHNQIPSNQVKSVVASSSAECGDKFDKTHVMLDLFAHGIVMGCEVRYGMDKRLTHEFSTNS